MVEHIVCFKVKPGATPEQEERLIDMLLNLKGHIPGIIDLTAGKTIIPERGQGYSIGLVVRFTDREALDAYQPDPRHQAVKEYSQQFCEPPMVIDYELR